jgi:uncharacterized protein YjbI with pentapeptide repeats
MDSEYPETPGSRRLIMVTFSNAHLVNPRGDTLVAVFYEYGYAGGGGDAACGPDQSGQGINGTNTDISNRWNVHIVGPSQVVLQETMHNCYLNWLNGVLATNDGNGNYFTSPSQALVLTVSDQGGGNVAFYAGGYIAANYSGAAYEDPNTGNFDYYPVQGAGSTFNSDFRFQFSNQLRVLVICGSATGCDLQGDDMSDLGNMPSLAGCNLSGASLQNTRYAGLTDKSLAGTNFTGAFLNGAKLDGVNVSQAIWTNATISSTAAPTDLSVIDTAAQNTDFSNAFLDGATLGATVNPPDFTGSKFVKAQLNGALMQNAILRKCHFNGASLQGAHLEGADLTGADLTDADFTGAHLTNTIMPGVTLHGTKFINVDLTTATVDTPANFNRDPNDMVNLTGATIPFAMLGLDWSYLTMTGATIENIPQNLDTLNANYAVFPDLLDLSSRSIRKATFDHAQMPDVHFGHSDLIGAVMTNASMQGGRLQMANLQFANLTNANLEASTTQLTDNKPSVALLDGAFLINATLDYVQANGASLQDVLFITYPAYGATPATAHNAQMAGAKLGSATLYAADFTNAQLPGADLSGEAVLINATFASVNLGPTQGGDSSNSSLRNSDIRGTQFGVAGAQAPTDLASMDGCDLSFAKYSTSSGQYSNQFADFYGNPIYIDDTYGPTLLGTTTNQTVCPDTSTGPCQLAQASERRAG